MTVYIDYGLCFGCGACAEVCPGNFVIRDDKAWFINSNKIDPEKCAQAVRVCVAGAIRIE